MMSSLRILIYVWFASVAFVAQAYSLDGYSELDVANINEFFVNTLKIDEKILRNTSGDQHAETLATLYDHQSYLAFGSSSLEAQVKSSMLCVIYHCRKATEDFEATQKRWESEPAEQIADEFRAADRFSSLPDNLQNNPAQLKEFLLHKNLNQPVCENPQQISARLIIYGSCFSAGYRF